MATDTYKLSIQIEIFALNFLNVYLFDQLINNTFCNEIPIIRRYSEQVEMFSKGLRLLKSVFHNLASHPNGGRKIYGIFDSYLVCQISELVQACFINAH